MMQEFLLPDPGEGLVEAEIVNWRVSVGEQVKINDILVEIETSKSIVELPSPYTGTVNALHVAEGETVEVGTPIIAIDDGQTAEAPAGDDQGSTDGGRSPNLVGYGARATRGKRRPRKSVAAPADGEDRHPGVTESFGTDRPVSHRHGEPAALDAGASEAVGGSLPSPGVPVEDLAPAADRPLAKPPVRKLAKDLGIDLHRLSGSGPDGVITREDVEAAAAAPQPSTEPAAAAEPVGAAAEDVRVPIKGVRKATAQAMVESAFTAPHVTEWVTLDVTATMDLVQTIRARKDFDGVKVTPLLIIAKACLLALRRNRSMNASWDEQAQEIIHYGRVNLGIAAATPRGLVVPNVKGADRMSLRELATAMTEMITVARDGKTQPADLAGGTFTITNVGTFGIDAGTPILNPGQSGILAVGAIDRRPWVVGTGADERIEPRWVSTLAVSFDHRIVDGEQGSQFLADLAQILGDPGTALLF